MWNEGYDAELIKRHAEAEAGGGETRIAEQHASGKLNAPERMSMLFDGEPSLKSMRCVGIPLLAEGPRAVWGLKCLACRPLRSSCELMQRLAYRCDNNRVI